MKLYYAPATCSLAPHIALREASLPFTLVRCEKSGTGNWSPAKLADGGSFAEVNPKGYVPVLELDRGERLTEVSAILQYIADQNPGSGLAPPNGSLARYHLQEWLNYLATEIHKSFWPFFHDGCEAERPNATERLERRFTWISEQLGEKLFLMGDTFTVADPYLMTMLNWTRPAGFDLNRWPVLKTYRSRLSERPSVQAAFEAEGLKKKA